MSATEKFELIKEEEIKEINSIARLYRHKNTGARILSLSNDDENKVFGITFRTPPDDSTGVAHIMEHSVLCGSRKYPVKEPFVELVKGSLNTFLNAMTYPDKTCYPVASQNLQDFYNLVDVYLDAVFYPLLTPTTFKQEGWHYELKSADDEMTFKGVVFNEMKGAYSSPDDYLSEKSIQSLFPDNTYGVDSGGNPQHIPDLTYEQFKNFHDTYYHPSNAFIFFYGDDDPENRLEIIENYLKDFNPLAVQSEIPLHTPFSEPRKITHTYDSGETGPDAKNYLTLNWGLGETTSELSKLEFQILNHILVGTPASPLRKALIESGLGEDLAGVGAETDLRQSLFSTGLKGVADQDLAKVEPFILQTLAQIATDGIEKDAIEASINTFEFSLRENNTGSFPRGLVIMLRSLGSWLYDLDPIAPLSFEAPLVEIRRKIASGERVFENLIQQNLLNNPYRTTVILTPDPEMGNKLAEQEMSRLQKTRQEMQADELSRIVTETQELIRYQQTPDSPEALATIPMLNRSDLETKVRTIPIEIMDTPHGKIIYHDLFTNGIVYLELGFNLHALPQELLPYLSLFGRALVEMGTQKENYVQLLQRIGRKTGGIYPSLLVSSLPQQKESTAWFILRGKAMANQAADLTSILNDILSMPNFNDRERFKQMALEERSSLESGLAPAGHRFVNSRLNAKYNEAGWVTEQTGGISYLGFLRKLIKQIDTDWEGIVSKLEEIRSTLVSQDNLFLNLTLDSSNLAAVQPVLEDFLGMLPQKQTQIAHWNYEFSNDWEGFTFPTQVNFVGKAANLYELGYHENGSALVITPYLRGTWIWDRIRVQGGAYGGFCLFDRLSGMFSYLSYRDPNLENSLDVYDQTAQFLRDIDLSESELTKAIIGTIGDLDSYMLPDAKGYTSLSRYLIGVSDAERQKLRDEVLSTSQADFKVFAEFLDLAKSAGKVVVLGSAEAIQKAAPKLPQKLTIEKVL
jgi:hypothetical protein